MAKDEHDVDHAKGDDEGNDGIKPPESPESIKEAMATPAPFLVGYLTDSYQQTVITEV